MAVTFMHGHVLEQLELLEAESFQCIFTSPPYWSLRSYKTPHQVWGGDSACDHAWVTESKKPRAGAGRHGKTSQFSRQSRSITEAQVSAAQTTKGCFCRKCGAWKGEHGLEPTVDLWLHHEITIWRALRRVLRKDGVAWLNIGDAYTSSTNGRSRVSKAANADGGKRELNVYHPDNDEAGADRPYLGKVSGAGLRPKQRLMLPARLSLALQADGWYIRDEVVWHKRNPMPSSAADRTTPAHEMLYMLTKRAKYFYDGVAIQEPASWNSHARVGKNKWPSGWDVGEERPNDGLHRNGRGGVSPKASLVNGQGNGHPKSNPSFESAVTALMETRNKRSVWSITTEPLDAPHFAAAPKALVEPSLLATTSARGACIGCGTPWRRVVEKKAMVTRPSPNRKALQGASARGGRTQVSGTVISLPESRTIGWVAACKCNGLPVRPCRVLDPFGGSGTTAVVAQRLGLDSVMIDLQPDYIEIAKGRVAKTHAGLPGLA